MKQHRFILQDPELVHQMARVLKLKKGESVVLSDGKGMEAEAEIEEISSEGVSVMIDHATTNDREPARDVRLYCALLKRENFEWVVQKATEVGVKEIVPIITRRTIKLNFKLDRLQKIAKEAAEQSGRGIVPIIHDPIDFELAVKEAQDSQQNFFFDLSGKSTPRYALPVTRYALFIGPEGGWDDDERALAEKSKFQIASLGSLTLRAETAAVIATYLACNP